jgi:hypothetical protein
MQSRVSWVVGRASVGNLVERLSRLRQPIQRRASGMEPVWNSGSFASVRKRLPNGFGRYPRLAALTVPRKCVSASATLALAAPVSPATPRSVVPTPQLALSKPSQNQNENQLQHSPRASTCGECVCKRRFEIPLRKWICPDCQRHIVIEWGAWSRVSRTGRLHLRLTAGGLIVLPGCAGNRNCTALC